VGGQAGIRSELARAARLCFNNPTQKTVALFLSNDVTVFVRTDEKARCASLLSHVCPTYFWFIRILRTSSQLIATSEFPDICDKPVHPRNVRRGAACVFRTKGTSSPPGGGYRAVGIGRSAHAETLDNRGKTDIIVVSRALLASNPIERREGRVFRRESRPFRFKSLPFVLKTRRRGCRPSGSKYASVG